MAKKKKKSKAGFGLSRGMGRALVAGVILLAIGGGVAFFVLRSSKNASILSAHEASLQRYLTVRQEGAPGDPYLPGKVVTVDTSVKEIDPTFLDLPGELCAENPAAVGAVVLLNWQVKNTGMEIVSKSNPSVKSPLYEKTCDITVVELATGRVTARTSVTSKTNPDKHTVEDVHEGRPTGQVVAYLKNLPRK